jgi:hypothetical protein
MQDRFYIVMDVKGNESSPITERQLFDFARNRTILPQTMICEASSRKWFAASEHPALSAIFNQQSNPFATPNPANPFPSIKSPRFAVQFRAPTRRDYLLFSISVLIFGAIFSHLLWVRFDLLGIRSERALEHVHLGMSKSQVLDQMGDPTYTQSMTSIYGDSSYWYYGRTQISFNGSRVTSVNRY